METREASALFVLLFLLAPSAFSLFSGKTFAYSYFSLLGAKMEDQGIDPCTFRMQSGRSTI